MCYAVYLSTDSPENLAGRNCELAHFDKLIDAGDDPCITLLEWPNKWYVGSKSGCSCTFRFLHPESVGLGFSEPEQWYPEAPDELEATRALYRTLASLLSAGFRVDLLSRWEGARPEDIVTLDVSFDGVPERAFRMFENHRFRCAYSLQDSDSLLNR